MGFNLFKEIGKGTKKIGHTITKPFVSIGHGLTNAFNDTGHWLQGAGDTILGAASYTGKSLLGDVSNLTNPIVLIAIVGGVVVLFLMKK